MSLKTRPDLNRFMETFAQQQQQRFTGSDRLLSLFSRSDHPAANASDELDEDDIFSLGYNSPKIPMARNPNPNSSAAVPGSNLRRFADRSLGVLAALPDRNPSPNPNLMPMFSISCSSSAMTIPAAAKPKASATVKVYHQSAPMKITAMKVVGGVGKDEDDEEMMMMPPHEIVARREGRESSPMTTFSVLEGVGRTLKGRDLRRVRNAVFRTTGFED